MECNSAVAAAIHAGVTVALGHQVQGSRGLGAQQAPGDGGDRGRATSGQRGSHQGESTAVKMHTFTLQHRPLTICRGCNLWDRDVSTDLTLLTMIVKALRTTDCCCLTII